MFVLYFPTLPQPEHQPFLQKSLVPVSKRWYLGTKDWVLSVLVLLDCHCFQVLSMDSARKQVGVYVYPYISMSMCMHAYTYLAYKFISILPIPIQHYSIHSCFFLSHILKHFFLTERQHECMGVSGGRQQEREIISHPNTNQARPCIASGIR